MSQRDRLSDVLDASLKVITQEFPPKDEFSTIRQLARFNGISRQNSSPFHPPFTTIASNNILTGFTRISFETGVDKSKVYPHRLTYRS